MMTVLLRGFFVRGIAVAVVVCALAALLSGRGALASNLEVVLGEGAVTAIGAVARLHQPGPIAFSPDGKQIYLGFRSTHKVMRINNSDWGSTWFLGAESPEGKWPHPFDATNPLKTAMYVPEGIAVSPDGCWVYVSDSDGGRVLKVSVAGDRVIEFAGGSDWHRGRHLKISKLNGPSAIAVDPEGQIVYVLDRWNHRVLAITSDGKRVDEYVGGLGEGNRLDEFSGRNTELRNPDGVALSPDGRDLYVADSGNGRILKISEEGQHVEHFAGLTPDAGAAKITLARTIKMNPLSIAISHDGLSLLVVDAISYRLLKFSTDGNHVTALTGHDVKYQTDTPTSAAITSQMGLLSHLAVSPVDASIFLSDWGPGDNKGRILRVLPDIAQPR